MSAQPSTEPGWAICRAIPQGQKYRSGKPVPNPWGKEKRREVEEVCSCCGRATDEARILLPHRGRYKVIPVPRINALLARDKWVEVYTDEGLQGLSDISIVSFCSLFPRDWIQVHRGAAVRASAILGAGKPEREGEGPRAGSVECLFVTGCPIPIEVSRRNRRGLRAAFLRHHAHALHEIRRLAENYEQQGATSVPNKARLATAPKTQPRRDKASR